MLRQYSFPLFVVVLIMLVLVLIPGIGTEAQGARRWFNVGGFSVQPSEIMKVALAIWGAHLLASRRPERPIREVDPDSARARSNAGLRAGRRATEPQYDHRIGNHRRGSAVVRLGCH